MRPLLSFPSTPLSLAIIMTRIISAKQAKVIARRSATPALSRIKSKAARHDAEAAPRGAIQTTTAGPKSVRQRLRSDCLKSLPSERDFDRFMDKLRALVLIFLPTHRLLRVPATDILAASEYQSLVDELKRLYPSVFITKNVTASLRRYILNHLYVLRHRMKRDGAEDTDPSRPVVVTRTSSQTRMSKQRVKEVESIQVNSRSPSCVAVVKQIEPQQRKAYRRPPGFRSPIDADQRGLISPGPNHLRPQRQPSPPPTPSPKPPLARLGSAVQKQIGTPSRRSVPFESDQVPQSPRFIRPTPSSTPRWLLNVPAKCDAEVIDVLTHVSVPSLAHFIPIFQKHKFTNKKRLEWLWRLRNGRDRKIYHDFLARELGMTIPEEQWTLAFALGETFCDDIDDL